MRLKITILSVLLLTATPVSQAFLFEAIGAAVAIAAAPIAAPLLGFTSAGIAAGSIASGLMSTAAIANGGGVASMAAGGVVAAMQSVGVVGIGATSAAALGAAGAKAGEKVKKSLGLDDVDKLL